MGRQLAEHPAGELAIQHRIDCSLLAGEDATRNADVMRVQLLGHRFTRPATLVERELLAAIGYDEASTIEELTTRVDASLRSVVVRTWPQLQTTTQPAPAP